MLFFNIYSSVLLYMILFACVGKYLQSFTCHSKTFGSAKLVLKLQTCHWLSSAITPDLLRASMLPLEFTQVAINNIEFINYNQNHDKNCSLDK